MLKTRPVSLPLFQQINNRNNNFNLIRLILALLVLLSHSPELIDENRNREILTYIFGTYSFGEFAVNCFFILSGFLIVQSWEHKPNILDFLQKRVLRIYPAFIIASIISALILGKLATTNKNFYETFNYLQLIKGFILLEVPQVPNAFEGYIYRSVNGSMWTIAYEFRCYILVAFLGIIGLIKRKYAWLTLTGISIFLFFNFKSIGLGNIEKSVSFTVLLGDKEHLLRLVAYFCTGSCFYLFRDRIAYNSKLATIAVILLVSGLLFKETAFLALLICGSYLLFWLAFTEFKFLAVVRKFPDVSYGLYLYGWPVQKLLIMYIPSISPWILFLLSGLISFVLGLLSWHLVERPMLKLKKNSISDKLKSLTK